MKTRSALLCAVLALAAGCAAVSEKSDTSEQLAQPIDRLLIGAAAKYPADLGLRARASEFEGSMAARRKMAWDVVAKVLTPVLVPGTALLDGGADGPAISMPRFQTWYSSDDFFPMFDRLFRALPAGGPGSPEALLR